MVLEDKDILQADAAIVAGILILLTIMHLRPESLREKRILKTQISLITFAILPFTISVLSMIWFSELPIAEDSTSIGFVYLIIAILFFVWSPYARRTTMQKGED
jgi:hypothetical protein